MTLPPAEDMWSPREPLASPFPPSCRPGDRSAQRRTRAAQGGALVWRYEARPVPVKKAQCLSSSPPVTLSHNNELGLYTPRSLRSADLRPWGSLPRLAAALRSALVRRLEDQKTRVGAGRGLLLWISLSVALLSGSGLKLMLDFYRCVRGVPFLVRAVSCLLDLVWFGTHVHRLSLAKLLASRTAQSTRWHYA